jgi:hypothetical protein
MDESKANSSPPKRGVRFAEEDDISYKPASPSATNAAGSAGEFKTELLGTPKIRKEDLQYRKPSERIGSKKVLASSHGSIVKPNFEDMLRRVSVVLQQHINKCEDRLKRARDSRVDHIDEGLFYSSQADKFCEEKFLTPQYRYHFVRAPICRLGFLYGIREVEKEYLIPTSTEIHDFLTELFVKAQLSAECSIVCLIYIERLMETANVPLLKNTWRCVVMGGMLLASKVWQDMSSWNIEFTQVYPQYNIQAINSLERLFCSEIKWNLYISQSQYAKYYFALRSIHERKRPPSDNRKSGLSDSTLNSNTTNHNNGIDQVGPGNSSNSSGLQSHQRKDYVTNAIARNYAPTMATQVSAATDRVKEELLNTVLSRSL